MESKHKSDYGKFVLTAGKFYGDAEKDKGKWRGYIVFTRCGCVGNSHIVLDVKLCSSVSVISVEEFKIPD